MTSADEHYIADLINALADIVHIINLYDAGKMDDGSTRS